MLLRGGRGGGGGREEAEELAGDEALLVLGFGFLVLLLLLLLLGVGEVELMMERGLRARRSGGRGFDCATFPPFITYRIYDLNNRAFFDW